MFRCKSVLPAIFVIIVLSSVNLWADSSLNKEDADGSLHPMAIKLFRQAEELSADAFYEEAIVVLGKALKYADEPEIYMLTGSCYSSLGEKIKEYKTYIKGCKAHPENIALLGKVNSQAIRLGEFSRARQTANLIYAQDQSLGRLSKCNVYLGMGTLAKNKGELKKAMKCFSKALSFEPSNVQARYGFTQCKKELDKTDKTDKFDKNKKNEKLDKTEKLDNIDK
jgi:tetratricopeptide (TPR) repeat protein